jgi:hypothetical protein
MCGSGDLFRMNEFSPGHCDKRLCYLHVVISIFVRGGVLGQLCTFSRLLTKVLRLTE